MRPSPQGDVQPLVPTQIGLGPAVGAAAVAAVGVAVVALLGALLDAVAAGRRRQAWPGVGQVKPGSMRQLSPQPSPVGDVAVVALLGAGYDAVAAAGRCRRAPASGQVQPGSTAGRSPAAVAGGGVAVVAGLGARDDAVAAAHGVRAGFAGRRANPVGLGMAIGRASVTAHLIAVVAALSRRVRACRFHTA